MISQRPFRGSLMITPAVEQVVETCEAAGCVVKRNEGALTIEVTDPESEGLFVFRAVQKGFLRPWIAMFFNTERIKWTDAQQPGIVHSEQASDQGRDGTPS